MTNAAVLYFSLLDGGLHIYYWLVAVFMTVTVPITTIFLMRAALFRERLSGRNTVPPSVSVPHGPQSNDQKTKGKP